VVPRTSAMSCKAVLSMAVPQPSRQRRPRATTLETAPKGFIGFSLISDVQDEKLRAELMERGLAQRDAEHITQAVCNNSDVFLTRDVKSIIGPGFFYLIEDRVRPRRHHRHLCRCLPRPCQRRFRPGPCT
jgi:hypothetical protein